MHIVDITIIVVFLIATLYIGFNSSKKIKTFSDYAIGNRKFSDFAIFCTLAATIIGGTATMGEVGKFYDVGIVQFLAEIVEPIEYLVIAVLLARHFGNYYGCFSVGDIFYKSYGITGKVLVGLVGSIYEILLVALQFVAMGTGISILTGFSYITSLWISAGIILIYTGRGGIRAVTFTDVLQFIILIIALPILLITTIGKIGGLSGLIEQLPKSHLTIKTEDFHRYLFLMVPLLIPLLSPILVHRLLMTSNREQGVRAYRNLAWTYAFLILLTSLLGLTAKVLFPNLSRGDEALLTLITNGLPVGIFGIAVIGILAVLMSTADSHLNCGSVMLVNDLILPFAKRELSECTKLKMVRITSLIIGICALIVASQRFNIFETRIIVSTLWFSVIISPLYFLLFNMKISHKGLLISALFGFTTCIFWNLNIKPVIKIDGLLPGFLISGLFVLLFYFLGGRQKVFTKEELERMRRAEEKQIKKQPSIHDLQIRNNTVLGLCLVFLQLMPLMFNTHSLTYSKLMLTLINGTMAILLVFGRSLDFFAKGNRFQWLKLTTLFFCLPVTSAYLFLSSTENSLHILTLLFSFVVMIASVEKKYETPIGFACFLTAVLTVIFYFASNCQLSWPETFAWQHSFYIVGYVAILFLLRSNLNIKEQEKYRERYMLARSLSHDLISPLMAFHLLTSQKKPSEFDEKESQLLKNIADEMCGYVNDFIVGSLKDYQHLKPENLNQCVLSCIEKQSILNKNLDIQLQAQETVFARVDAVLLRRIINNLVNVCRHALPNGCNTIVIAIDNDSLGNTQILLQAANGGFSAKALNSMFIEDQKLGDEIDLGISFNEFQDIVAKWHGKLEIISHNDNAIIQILLPNENHDKLIKG